MTKLPKAKIFLIVCLAFIVGVGIGSFVSIPFLILYGVSLIGLVIAVLSWGNRKVRVVGLCLIFCVLGMLRYELSLPQATEHDIQFYNDQKVRFLGVVKSEPDVRKNHVKLTIKAVQGIEGAPKEIGGNILIKTSLYPEYHYGDLLDITCQLQAPEPLEFETSAGIRTFNYDKYLARFDIYSVCYRPKVELVGHEYGNVIMACLLNIKSSFMRAVQQSLPEPQASFLGGLILGAKKAIPDDLMESFNRTGTTHIVALSGYNITIIAVLILNMCKHLWISRKGAFWVSLGAITFFVLIAGAQASILRAGIMGLLVLLATQLGRASRITNVLALAAVVMLIINPKVLVFDAGFQLSFLATIGLVYVSPRLEKFFRWVPVAFEIRGSLLATLSATIMTLPLILFQFGRLSIVAPLVNVLILPTIPIAMAFGFVTGLLAIIWLPLGQMFGWIVWTILSYIIFMVEAFAKFNFASFDIGQISWLWLAVGYSLLSFFIFRKKKLITAST